MSRQRILNFITAFSRHVLTYVFVIIILFPVLWMMYGGFKAGDLSFNYPPVFYTLELTLDHLIRILTATRQVREGIINSLMIASISALISSSVATFTAYGNSRFEYKGKGLVTYSSLTMYLFPPITLIIPLFVLFSLMGLYNSRIPLVIIYVGLTLPFSMWFMTDYINTIPRDLDDQARVDGASFLQIAFKIIFPLVLPGFAAATMYAWVIAWGEYLMASIFIQSTSKQTISLTLNYYFRWGTAPWPETGAAVFLSTLPPVIIFMVLFRTFTKGLSAGAIKQ